MIPKFLNDEFTRTTNLLLYWQMNFLVRLFLCLSTLALVINGQAQGVNVAQIPSWVKSVEYSDAVRDTANTGGGYYDLLSDDQWNLATKESYHHYVQKVLSETGLTTLSSISQSYDPAYQTLTFHTLLIKRNGQVINKLNARDFKVLQREEDLDRLIYDGSLTALYTVTDLQVGDVLEYAYSLKGWNPAFGNKFFRSIYLNYTVPIGLVFVRVIAIPGSEPTFAYRNQVPEPTIYKNQFGVVREWKLDRVPALVYDDGTNDWYEPHNRIEISSFVSWQEVALWASQLYKNAYQSNPALKIKIAEWQKIKDKEKALNECIRFVQDEVRYLSFSEGIHGFKPHEASKVFDQRFGDCKDKSVLLSYMAGQLGFESKPVLVSSSRGKLMNELLPSPGRFDHCIAMIKLYDTTVWIDPTMTLQRGDLRKRITPSYHYGLIVDQSTQQLSPMPGFNGPSGITFVEKFDVAKVGTSAKLSVTTTYVGDEANIIRDEFRSSSLASLTKNYLNFYANDYPEIKTVKPVSFKDDEAQNIFITEEEYTIDPFWKYDSSAKKYQMDIYPRAIASYLKTPSTKIRTMPYGLRYPLNLTQRIEMNMPETWSVTKSDQTFQSPGFTFITNFEGSGKHIVLNYSYRMKKPYLEPGEVKEHVAKVNEVYDHLNFNVSYNSTAGAKPNLSSGLLIFTLIVMGAGFFLMRRIYAYDPEPKESLDQYGSIGGWLILPMIGVLISPFWMFFVVVKSALANPNIFQVIGDPNFDGYNPALGIFALGEYVANILLLCYALLVAVLFVQQRSSLPRLVVIFYAVSFLDLALDALIGLAFDLEITSSDWKGLVRSIISCAIWIPYFLNSDRVHGTFKERLRTTGNTP